MALRIPKTCNLLTMGCSARVQFKGPEQTADFLQLGLRLGMVLLG